MKKLIVVILTATLIFVFAGCSAEKSKKEVFDLVENNYDSILKACEEKDEDALLSINSNFVVKIIEGYVIVLCKSRGISVSSQDYGFYYSEYNSPIMVDCNQNVVCLRNWFIPKGEGYEYVDDSGVCYTEHIKGNIYFYQFAT